MEGSCNLLINFVNANDGTIVNVKYNCSGTDNDATNTMIEITSAKAHEVSLNCKMAQNRTENTSLCVLEESLEELTTTA